MEALSFAPFARGIDMVVTVDGVSVFKTALKK
jgi:hypothetical protein